MLYSFGKKKKRTGVPFVAQWLMNPARIHEDVGLVPGHAQWVKDLAFPGAVVYIADSAWILCCCSCDIGQQLQLRFDPYPGNFHTPQVRL